MKTEEAMTTYTVINTQITKVLMDDASRPWAVMATTGTSRKIIGRYATKAQAQRRANDKARA
jgi:hypothetical protein